MAGGHAHMTKRLGRACGGRSELECCARFQSEEIPFHAPVLLRLEGQPRALLLIDVD